jgi:hypothetical protein
MSHYDPWAHASHLFQRRLAQYLLLSIGLGLAQWAALLHWLLGADFAQIVRVTMTVGDPKNVMLAALLCQALALGALVAGVLFAWLLRRGGMRGGERHLRGARVQDESQ